MQKDVLLKDEEVIALIPQKAPFVMVDTLVESTEGKTVSELTITGDNIFTSNSEFQEPGIVENIAQTCALGAGYYFSQTAKEGDEPPLGFIGAIKNLNIHALPKEGSTLQTTIVVEQKVFDITLVSGKVKCNGEIIADCQMKIFIQPKEA